MSDRLEKIKSKETWGWEVDDILWLMGEAEIWTERAKTAEVELEQCQAENAELNAIFELERTRSKQADKMWQKATDNPGTIPDLGVLLEWLIGEVKRFRHRGRLLIRLHRNEMSAQAAALSKMINQSNEDVVFWSAQAERFKARVGELLDILAKHGISHG